MTLGQLLFRAAVFARICDPADANLPPEQQAFDWQTLDDFIDLLGVDRLSMFREQRVGPFTVTSGQGSVQAASPITIGPGGNWDTPRPTFIDRAGVIYTAGGPNYPELPVKIYTTKEWAQVQVKATTSTLSRNLFYDRTFTDPTGRGHIYLYPVPSQTFQMVLYVGVALEKFPLDGDGNPDYTVTLALPDGYRAMYTYNLAKLMCVGLWDCPADLQQLADDSLAKVKYANVVTQMDPLSCDAATLQGDQNKSGWDWITGGFQ